MANMAEQESKIFASSAFIGQENNHKNSQNSGSKFNRGKDYLSSDDDPEVMFRSLIRSKEAGPIIGKQGSNISRLRKDYDTNVQVPRSNTDERLLTIEGQISSVCNCLRDILKSVAEKNDAVDEEYEVSVLVSSHIVGALIGKGGSNLSNMRKNTGANGKVSSDCLPGSTDRVCTIYGDLDNVIPFVAQVMEIISKSPGARSKIIDYNPGDEGESNVRANKRRRQPSEGDQMGESRNLGSILGDPRGLFGSRDRQSSGGSFRNEGRQNPGSLFDNSQGNMFGSPGRNLLGNQSLLSNQNLLGAQNLLGNVRESLLNARQGLLGNAQQGLLGNVQQGLLGNARQSLVGNARSQQGNSFGDNSFGDFSFDNNELPDCFGKIQKTELTIDNQLVGHIIGRGGERIREIRARSGAAVSVSAQEPDCDERVIIISGTKQQNDNAQWLMKKSVKYGNAPL